jgi:hypothetical protein
MEGFQYLFAVFVFIEHNRMKRIFALNQTSFLKSVERLRTYTSVDGLRRKVMAMEAHLDRGLGRQRTRTTQTTIRVSRPYILGELKQIREARTLDRAQYYIGRLRKSLTSEKLSKVNDLNLRRWKEYEEILTDSLWVVPRRDGSGNHSAWYWGNFIPQIPHQLLLRYTKKGDWILDPFAGSGTTLLECKRLDRNGVGIELNPRVVRKTRALLKAVPHHSRTSAGVHQGDSTTLDFRTVLQSCGASSVQFVLLHPPYHDIIRFSRSRRDLSNAGSVNLFLELFGKVIDNSLKVLDKKRYLAVVIGDKYNNRAWIPLGFFVMNEVLKRKCLLKSIVVKNFDQTLGKRKQSALWRYRALVGGFYVFKHEYIFVFQKI